MMNEVEQKIGPLPQPSELPVQEIDHFALGIRRDVLQMLFELN